MIVSIITTTYNRPQFIPRLIEAYKRQTYEPLLMEWVVLDDGTEKVGHIFREQAGGLNIRYFSIDEKLPMGSKLNILNKVATGDIILVMDDDDYYPPTRVSSVVEAFQKNPKKELTGSSKVYMYATDTATIYCAGPYHDRHALNCTLAYRFTYLKTHAYDDKETCAVERVFLNDFTEPMIQLEDQILHIIHSSNTFKNKMGVSLMKKTDKTLEDFIKDPQLRAYFQGNELKLMP
jgi:glycosyltransferase involved in cell wall biosynthesis